jgi:hypothetical protein
MNPIHWQARQEAHCKSCGATPGQPCRNRHGGIAWPPHKARIDALADPNWCKSLCTCGLLDWTIREHGRVTHKHNCEARTDPFCQTHPDGCPLEESNWCKR